MKKIVLASAAMGGAALVAFGAAGTFAAFTDSGSTVVPSAQAGTLFLSEQTPTVSTTGLSLDRLAPGQSVTYYVPIQNAGNLPGFISGRIVMESQSENGCFGPEKDDPTCVDNGPGQLAQNTSVTSAYGPLTGNQGCDASFRPAAQPAGTLADLTSRTTYSEGLPIAADQSYCSVITVTVNESAGNNIQSDRFAFRYDYRLTQTSVAAGAA